jgi:hypothetical protein
MIDAFLASFSTTALLLAAAWLARTWIKERLTVSLRLETEPILEEIKSRYAKQVALTESRVSAYKDLWERTSILSPRGKLELDKGQLDEVFKDLRIWYYEKGNAMHLSASTTNDFLKGLEYLEQEPSADNLSLIKKIFSSLRTHIKEDLGVYDKSDVSAKLPDYEKPLADGVKIAEPSHDA